MTSLEQSVKPSSSDIALKETLELLEWPRLCTQVSTFACTKQGKNRCKNLTLPSDIALSRRKLAETLEIGALDKCVDGGLNFQGIHDLEEILSRCHKGGIANGEELLKVANTLSIARSLKKQINDSTLRPVVTELVVDLVTLPDLEKLLKSGLEEGGRIADRASKQLANYRNQLQGLRLKRREIMQSLLRRFSAFLQDTVIAERYGRPVMALKAGTMERVPGIVHDSSASGNTIFIEPQDVISLGNLIVEIESQIFKEEQFLLLNWSGAVASHFEAIRKLCEVMLQLELALTRARYGDWVRGVAPTLSDNTNAPFHIKKFRHPLLVWQEVYEGGDEVVPISFEVSSELRVVAITGPNTGGKTVTLKSIGLVVLMARAGMLLPCVGSPLLPWCNQVLADIGDEQSLQQNLSTFSGHVTRISRIIDAIAIRRGPTIVLLDEVGAGTDPTEGTALAMALLMILADRARLTIATTHFGELKALKYRDSRFENASVAFDSETIQPTYHLQWGIPGKSNALAIARRLGLDQQVINTAKELIAPKGLDDINQVIKGLEEQRQRQQTAAETAAALLARTELLHEELLLRWREQKEQSADVKDLLRQEIELSIKGAQKEVRDLIYRLRHKGADGETARQVGKRLREMERDYSKKESKTDQFWTPAVGDRIRLLSLGKAGEVISISDDGLQVTVLCGLFRCTVDLGSLESLDGRKPQVVEPVVKIRSNTPFLSQNSQTRTNKNTVDVRGLRVHEAETVVDDVLRKTSGPVWVVHGIGTGKLKKGLRDWLLTVPSVERIADAAQSEGGPGCTVIWLH